MPESSRARQRRPCYRFCRWWPVLLTLVVLGLLAGAWLLRPLAPEPAALAALRSDATVTVTDQGWGFFFQPTTRQHPLGVAFYPGARVDARAYAPVLRRIAAAGYPVALLRVPLTLAILAQDRALLVLREHPELRWVLAGHSMGGVAAANLAIADALGRGRVVGLIFWASYPQHDLAAQRLPALAIFGDRDGLIDAQQREQQLRRMPSGTRVVVIDGLNHAGFGAYGLQPGDQVALLSPAEGWLRISQVSLDFLAGLAQRSEQP
ncbi:alpha/beta hydrolase [Kallotenue papyrolyticum]|uniref:alpha/beta hydrolase n=1 Tax=Kallotenue papyrolyticum TaxID=1325125 RepID=UPI0004786241|nr:alpha/beta hydrolase [Kallotenue papyrolyticum]